MAADEYTVTTSARRAQIVRAAIVTIAELGYDQASFSRITAEAGLSSPRLISYHFSNKDDLIRQVVTDVLDAGARFMMARIEVEQTAAGRLRAYLESNLQFLREHPREMTALTEIGPHLRTEDGHAFTSAGSQEPSVLGLEALLREGQRTGDFRDFDVRSMAVMIRGAIDAAAQRLRGEHGLDFDIYGHEIVTTFTLATSARPTGSASDVGGG